MEGSQVWWNKGHMKSDKEGGSGARWLSLSFGISPTSQHHDFGQITGPEFSHLHNEDSNNIYLGPVSLAINQCNCIWPVLKRAPGLGFGALQLPS